MHSIHCLVSVLGVWRQSPWCAWKKKVHRHCPQLFCGEMKFHPDWSQPDIFPFSCTCCKHVSFFNYLLLLLMVDSECAAKHSPAERRVNPKFSHGWQPANPSHLGSLWSPSRNLAMEFSNPNDKPGLEQEMERSFWCFADLKSMCPSSSHKKSEWRHWKFGPTPPCLPPQLCRYDLQGESGLKSYLPRPGG